MSFAVAVAPALNWNPPPEDGMLKPVDAAVLVWALLVVFAELFMNNPVFAGVLAGGCDAAAADAPNENPPGFAVDTGFGFDVAVAVLAPNAKSPVAAAGAGFALAVVVAADDAILKSALLTDGA